MPVSATATPGTTPSTTLTAPPGAGTIATWMATPSIAPCAQIGALAGLQPIAETDRGASVSTIAGRARIMVGSEAGEGLARSGSAGSALSHRGGFAHGYGRLRADGRRFVAGQGRACEPVTYLEWRGAEMTSECFGERLQRLENSQCQGRRMIFVGVHGGTWRPAIGCSFHARFNHSLTSGVLSTICAV